MGSQMPKFLKESMKLTGNSEGRGWGVQTKKTSMGGRGRGMGVFPSTLLTCKCSQITEQH